MSEDDPSAVETSAGPTPAMLATVLVKLLPFWSSDPEIWFAQVEATFTTRRVTAEKTQFDYVIASLSPEVTTTTFPLYDCCRLRRLNWMLSECGIPGEAAKGGSETDRHTALCSARPPLSLSHPLASTGLYCHSEDRLTVHIYMWSA